ncbi:MAG: replication-relaxation family protein [Bacteriovoracaceae bacterium]|nr:replication-relaxation family protein [Bacteriovoracaceae bacterium]
MKLTPRDLRLLNLLANYGMLSTKQIEKFVFRSIATTTVLRRLRVLERANLLKRITGLESHELLWMLTAEGGRTARITVPKSKWSKNMLEHDHKLVGLRIALEVSGISHSWTPEHEIRSFIFKKHGLKGMKNRIVPDAFMGIEVNGFKHSVAIELELTLKNKTKIRKTLSRYMEKGKFHALWYVAPKKSILDSVWRQWLALGGPQSGIIFYASLLPEVIESPLKVRLMGTKPHRIIGDTWTQNSVLKTAQEVSRQNETESKKQIEITMDYHAPFLQETG